MSVRSDSLVWRERPLDLRKSELRFPIKGEGLRSNFLRGVFDLGEDVDTSGGGTEGLGFFGSDLVAVAFFGTDFFGGAILLASVAPESSGLGKVEALLSRGGWIKPVTGSINAGIFV